MKQSVGRRIYDQYGTYIILVVLIIFFSCIASGFFSVMNLTNLLRTGSVYIIFGCGMTFVMISGKIDLSVGSIAALAGCVAALLTQAGASAIVASIVAIAVGAACGFINGFCIAKFRVPFFIMTAGMMYAAKGLALVLTHETSIRIETAEGALKFDFWGAITLGGVIPVQIIIAVIVFLICFYIMQNTKMGRYTYAIGSNERTARLSGVNVDKYNILIFTICGICAAIAGCIIASRLKTGSPTVADGGYNILAIASAAIGGTSLSGGEGKIAKTIVGAFVICVISVGLNIYGITSSLQNIIIGAVLVIVVAVDMLGKKRAI